MNSKMYAKYTSCLYNILEDYPNLLENLVLSTEERTNKFKEMFISKFFNYESGCETIGLLKITIENLFKSYKDYYEEMLDVYETKINYLEGIKSTTTIDRTDNNSYNNSVTTLPRVTGSKSIPSNKSEGTENRANSITETKTGNVNVIDLRTGYMKQIRNLYEEFVMKFKPCFCQLFN